MRGPNYGRATTGHCTREQSEDDLRDKLKRDAGIARDMPASIVPQRITTIAVGPSICKPSTFTPETSAFLSTIIRIIDGAPILDDLISEHGGTSREQVSHRTLVRG
jgi:hypothetical protein